VTDTQWYIGDLFNWQQEHTDAPISRECVKGRFYECAKYTQRTFDNYQSVARTFSLEDRV